MWLFLQTGGSRYDKRPTLWSAGLGCNFLETPMHAVSMTLCCVFTSGLYDSNWGLITSLEVCLGPQLVCKMVTQTSIKTPTGYDFTYCWVPDVAAIMGFPKGFPMGPCYGPLLDSGGGLFHGPLFFQAKGQ